VRWLGSPGKKPERCDVLKDMTLASRSTRRTAITLGLSSVGLTLVLLALPFLVAPLLVAG
jgi:hypothetical protein